MDSSHSFICGCEWPGKCYRLNEKTVLRVSLGGGVGARSGTFFFFICNNKIAFGEGTLQNVITQRVLFLKVKFTKGAFMSLEKSINLPSLRWVSFWLLYWVQSHFIIIQNQ